MSGSVFGVLFKVTTFGESHGPGVGAVVDGCPAGVPLDEAVIQAALDRRKPGAGGPASARREDDICRVLSGVFEGRTTGAPVALSIANTAQRPADYDNLRCGFRPGHADFTYTAKYGFRDHRGGGRSSARETAARVAAGAVAQAFLRALLGDSYRAAAYTIRAAGISAAARDALEAERNAMRAPDAAAAAAMLEAVAAARARGDSAGGIVECVISGVPAGLGEPVFDKLDAELAKAMLSLGAVKGIEFGAGFACADMPGSRMNDPIRAAGEGAAFESNNAGGVLGGISTGEPIVFRLAVKPTPSIALPQRSIERAPGGGFRDAELSVRGRHDACICPRIAPAAEAMAHLVIADMALRQGLLPGKPRGAAFAPGM